ncbi:hypothetical protein NI17_020210 [Thermobifida halotolerans]|uniref:non-specific serine/threonine protein kinase n=1 Tax=Thermobifida halotolerans TaxID=483545 RepID=A0AA97LW91_9ACTN|nr:serine/threonine-protein kinase [Thermobifida halotolerans]UOE19056.1 hypothetical protein NI17_020210 [Thermobifida halotolerans]
MSGHQHGTDWVAGFHSLEELYRGRTALLYRAVRSSTGAHAVLKVMRADDRTEREIAATRMVAGQPGTVALLDLGRTATGEPFLATAYYPDGSYAAITSRGGPLSVRESAAVGRAVAVGLTAVHTRGMLHNDVTPGNILRAGSGAVLIDFGSVGPVGAPPVPGDLRSETTLHAPPEALRGEPQSVASDVYRLASVLWFLLAGRAPFAVREGAPGPEGYRDRALSMPAHPVPRPDVPERVQEVLLRALAKGPADRYATPAEFAAALEEARVSAPARPAAPPRPPEPLPEQPEPQTTGRVSPRLSGRGLPLNRGEADLASAPDWSAPTPPSVLSAPTGPNAPRRSAPEPPTQPVRPSEAQPEAVQPSTPAAPTGPPAAPVDSAPPRRGGHAGRQSDSAPDAAPVRPEQHAPEPPVPAIAERDREPDRILDGGLHEWAWTRLEGWSGTAETAALPRDGDDDTDDDRHDDSVLSPAGSVESERRPLYVAAVVLSIVFFSGTSGMLSLLSPGPWWSGDLVPTAAAEPSPSAQPSPSPPPSPSPSEPPLVPVEPTGIWMYDNGSSVQLFWVDNTEGDVPHHVFGGPEGLARASVLEAEPGAETAIVSGLDPALEYCFTVAAVAGESEEQIVHSGVICTTRAEDLLEQQEEAEESAAEESPEAEGSPSSDAAE